jgi:hypothetical protein
MYSNDLSLLWTFTFRDIAHHLAPVQSILHMDGFVFCGVGQAVRGPACLCFHVLEGMI